MFSQLFGSSNQPAAEKKPEPSGDILGSILGSIAKPATEKKPSQAPKSTSDANKHISKPSANGKSSDMDREEHRIKKRAPESDKERSRDAEKGRDSYSNRNGPSDKSARNGAGDYDPLGNSSIKKDSSKPRLGREDSLDIPIKKKPADPSRRDDGSPKIKKREPSSPIIKKKEPSSIPPKRPDSSAPIKKPDSSAPIRKPESSAPRKPESSTPRKPESSAPRRPETSAPIRKPDSSQPPKRPDTSKSPAPRPSAPSSGNSSSRPPQRPSTEQSSRPVNPVQARLKGQELERKMYPGASAPQKPQLKTSSNPSASGKPGLSKPSGPSSGSLSKPPQRPPSSGSAPSGKPLVNPGSAGPAKPSGTPGLIKKPVPGGQPPAKPGIRPGSTGSAPPKTMTGKPLLAAKPGIRREDIPKDRVRPMNAPPSKPGAMNINGKRPNEKGLSSRHEPDVQKKPKMTQAERGHLFHDIFRGKPKKPMGMGMGKGRGGYSDEEDYDDNDSFIDDGSDPDDEARKELDKMMGMYRHKVQKRRGWEEESSDMETGFDDLQVEESYSRFKGKLEDQAEFEHIRKEAMEEEKKKKKKKLQID